VVFTWDPPILNGPNLISYKIVFENKTNPLTPTYTESSDCDGTNSSIMNTRTCTISMNEFISARGFSAG